MAIVLIGSVNSLVGIYRFILLVHILSSWIPQLRHSMVGQVLAQLSEPYLGLFRGIIPPLAGMDFSPILAFIVLHLVQRALNQVLLAL